MFILGWLGFGWEVEKRIKGSVTSYFGHTKKAICIVERNRYTGARRAWYETCSGDRGEVSVAWIDAFGAAPMDEPVLHGYDD